MSAQQLPFVFISIHLEPQTIAFAHIKNILNCGANTLMAYPLDFKHSFHDVRIISMRFVDVKDNLVLSCMVK